MADPIMDFSDAPGGAPKPARRGRPRSQDTIVRDDRVLALLKEGPHTREQLVEKIGLAPNLVYLSLWRLKRLHLIERTSSDESRHVWRVA